MAVPVPATRVGVALLSARRVQRYWRLRVTDHFTVDLLRDGRPVTLRYQIVS